MTERTTSLLLLTLLSRHAWGFLLQPSSLDIQMQAFKYPRLDTSTSAHGLSDRVWKGLFNFLLLLPRLYKILGLLPPGFWIRSCPLDLLGFFYVRITAILYCPTIWMAFLFPDLEKAVLEGRGFRPRFSVKWRSCLILRLYMMPAFYIQRHWGIFWFSDEKDEVLLTPSTTESVIA
jgi:hypothetical protein